jgi:uncharacterized membrane protein YfcA
MIISPDLINALFETIGSLFVILSIVKLRKDKIVRGVNVLTIIFFSSWGFWNLFYYPHLGQWLSFAGGCLITAANTTWIFMIIYFNYREKGRWKLQNKLQPNYLSLK